MDQMFEAKSYVGAGITSSPARLLSGKLAGKSANHFHIECQPSYFLLTVPTNPKVVCIGGIGMVGNQQECRRTEECFQCLLPLLGTGKMWSSD